MFGLVASRKLKSNCTTTGMAMDLTKGRKGIGSGSKPARNRILLWADDRDQGKV